MKLEYYQQYWHFKAIGRRDEAKKSIQQFVESFTSIALKEQWTRQFLEEEYNENLTVQPPSNSVSKFFRKLSFLGN